MAVRGIDHNKIDARLDQPPGAVEAFVSHGRRGGDAQAALLVLAGVRIGDRFLHVLYRDQPDAAVLIVDHEQLLDAVLMEEALGLVLPDALGHGDQPLLGHQLGHALAGVGGEAHVAIGENADQLAGPAGAATLDYGNAGNAVVLHQRERVGERGRGSDGDRVHHHAGFELLDLADLRGLGIRLEIAMEDAEASGLRHGDRHLGFGHRVHGRGDDRDIEGDFASDPGADIGIGRQQFGQSRLEQDVVEGEGFPQGSVGFLVHCHSSHPACGLGRRAPSEADSARSAAKRQSRARLDDPFWVGAGR